LFDSQELKIAVREEEEEEEEEEKGDK